MDLHLTKAQTRTLKKEGKVIVTQNGAFNVSIKCEKSKDELHKKVVQTVTIKEKEPIKVFLANLKNESEFDIKAHFVNELEINADTTFNIEVNDHMDAFEDYADCKNKFKKLAADAERFTELGKPNQFDKLILYEVTAKGKRIERASWTISKGFKWND